MTIVGRVAPGTQSPPNLADRIAVHKPWTSKNQAQSDGLWFSWQS